MCVNGLTRITSGVFHCKLSETAQVSVLPGDILGLELPVPGSNANVSTRLYFARVPRGPTNYVFREPQLSSQVTLTSSSTVNTELPQITVEVEPGIDMTSTK